MPEHTTTSSGGGSPAYVEVFGSNGQAWRFATGTKAGFAVRRIRSKLGEAAHHILCIAAFKENEEPVEFGPDAELAVYGDNWKLKLVQDPGHKETGAAQDTKSALGGLSDDNPVQQHTKMHDLIAEFYPGGKVPRGSKPEFSTEKRKRSRNWNIHEVLLLVQAKKDEWERTESSKSSKFESAVDKWVKVVEFLRENGITDRDLDQCRGKWDNLLSDFKTIKEWHRGAKATPYTCLTKEQKKQNKLPALFDTRAIDLLESFYGTRPKLMVAEDHQHQEQRPSYTATNNVNSNSNMSAVETALAIAACATTPPSATASTALGVPHKKIKSTSSSSSKDTHINAP